MFGVGALLGGLATDATQVIASRAVMGIGAAFIMPATLSIITSIFPPHERAKAIAIWAGFAGAGRVDRPDRHRRPARGLLVGLDPARERARSPWPSSPRCGPSLPTRGTTRTRRSTPSGALLSLVGLSALIFGIIQGPEDGWTSGSGARPRS